MENLNTMTSSQLNNFVANFEHNAFHQWTAGVNWTARDIEDALKNEDITNAVPIATPSRLSGRPLTEDEFKKVLYSDIHDLYVDIMARETINQGGTSTIIPITPDWFDYQELTDMWIEDYCKANDYEHMSDEDQAAFEEKTDDLLLNHALYIVDLNSELGALLQAFGWDKEKTTSHALAVHDKYENFLIVPENGANVENILFSEPEEATRFYKFALRKGTSVSINNRVALDDVDVEVTRAFAEAYASLNNIELSDSILDILAREAADDAEVFALPLDTVEGRTLATLWGIPAQPSFADNLALYQAQQVIVMGGNICRMQAMRIEFLQHA